MFYNNVVSVGTKQPIVDLLLAWGCHLPKPERLLSVFYYAVQSRVSALSTIGNLNVVPLFNLQMPSLESLLLQD
jgi:hypothetical protein